MVRPTSYEHGERKHKFKSAVLGERLSAGLDEFKITGGQKTFCRENKTKMD